MSRGRPPRMACREASAKAQQRGMVLDAAGMAKSRFDFVLFTGRKVIFVRVKRSHSRIIAIEELAVRFRGDIAEIRRIPLTQVVSRELWVLLPWGSWQNFCIGDDVITEIFEDSGKNTGTQGSPDEGHAGANVVIPVPVQEVPALLEHSSSPPGLPLSPAFPEIRSP